MTTAIVPVESAPEVARVELGLLHARGPRELVAAATDAANALRDVISSKRLSNVISGREHVRVEGWTTLAAMMGCLPREVAMVRDEKGTYTATAELVRIADGAVLTRATAECGIDEPTWAKRPDYARRSMAATRAVSRACRLAFSWVMVLAGYDPTPQEEIPANEESAAQPAAPSGVTRDTPWPGPGPTYELPVRKWKTAHLRMADEGTVKVPADWLAVVREELEDRKAQGKADRGTGALKEALAKNGAPAGPAPVSEPTPPTAAPAAPAKTKKTSRRAEEKPDDLPY